MSKIKELFAHYQPLTNKEISALWHDCVFSLDSAVLLGLYGYAPEKQANLIKVLEALSHRIWIPHQVLYEFYRDRVLVILNQEKHCSRIKALSHHAIQNLKGDLKKLNLDGSPTHSFVDLDKIFQVLDCGLETIDANLQELESKGPDFLSSDETLKSLEKLIGSRTIPNYSQVEFDLKYDEIAERYSSRIPPGYEDLETQDIPKAGDEDPKAYGDAIVWFQIIDYTRHVKRPLIFVTGEKRADWWWHVGDQVIGPRPELVRELKQKAAVAFHIYQTDEFITYAQNYLSLGEENNATEEILDFRPREPSRIRIVS